MRYCMYSTPLPINKHIFSYDWVQFHDGNDVTAPLLGCGKKWCELTPPTITSSDNTIYIEFHSDAGYVLSGFEIIYETGKAL